MNILIETVDFLFEKQDWIGLLKVIGKQKQVFKGKIILTCLKLNIILQFSYNPTPLNLNSNSLQKIIQIIYGDEISNFQ